MNILFLVCIFLRLCLVYIALILSKTNMTYLRIYGILAYVISVGFFVTEFLGLRKKGMNNQKVWWFRYIHSIFYGLFGYLAIQKNKNAYLVLLADVIFGISSYIYHYSSH